MSLQTHLAQLEKRHKSLQREIEDSSIRPSTSELELSELKRRKLQLKDQITKLKEASGHAMH